MGLALGMGDIHTPFVVALPVAYVCLDGVTLVLPACCWPSELGME